MNKYLLKCCFFLLFIFILNYQTCDAQATSLHEDFSTCISNLPSGWTMYSVTGTDAWNCTTSGHAGRGVQMSGYSNSQNNLNEDWLISPSLNFTSAQTPLLEFWSRTKYTGPFIQVFVSNNYSSGNPNTATWTQLSVILPTANSDTWFLSNGIDLSPFKSQVMHIAFKYSSTTNAAATWKLDDINVTDGTMTLSKKFINVGQVGAGNSSGLSSFSFTMSSLVGNLDLNIAAPFEISNNGTSFGQSLSYTNAASGFPQTIYIRISPSVANKVYRKDLTFTYNSLQMIEKVQVLGTSLPDDKTLRVYNWNMRWFGDPSNCSCDTALAKNNAIQLLKDINADIYCLQEIVSINQVAQIANALGANYQYVISPFCSGAISTTSQYYATGQKLAYIFNTDKITNAGTFGLLASTYPSDTSAYYCFSSGRFPFIFKAALKLAGGNSDTMIFTNIHGKASATVNDYTRRQCAAQKMTDSINALFPNKKVIVLGDYNDYLVGTFVTGQTNSPYQYVLNQGFTGITLPSQFLGQTTFVGSTNHIIDNVVCSAALLPSYADSSSFIFSEPESYIESYSTSTSDHLGVMSYFKFQFPNTVNNLEQVSVNSLFNIVNPVLNKEIHMYFNHLPQEPLVMRIFDLSGRLIYQKKITVSSNQYVDTQVPIYSGIYFINLKGNHINQTDKLLVK